MAWGPCAGKVNKILLGMTAKPEPLHERHRYRIERRNGTTSIGSVTPNLAQKCGSCNFMSTKRQKTAVHLP